MSNIVIKENDGFRYVETNEGAEVLLLLHGLFGALSNFKGIIEAFSDDYNVVVPMLPMFEMPMDKVSVEGLVEFVDSFVEYKGYKKVNVLGNSLGGHIAQVFALKRPDLINSMILTGSSGLFENAMGSSFPKRGDYDYIKTKTESTFYNPEIASKELVDEVFDIVNDRTKAIRILYMAKSAIRSNLEEEIKEIKAPTMLIWGKQDSITPPFVGEKFDELIPNSTLKFVDQCGHAPMMEKPAEFNQILKDFLVNLN